jgi:hypothetical protein
VLQPAVDVDPGVGNKWVSSHLEPPVGALCNTEPDVT